MQARHAACLHGHSHVGATEQARSPLLQAMGVAACGLIHAATWGVGLHDASTHASKRAQQKPPIPPADVQQRIPILLVTYF